MAGDSKASSGNKVSPGSLAAAVGMDKAAEEQKKATEEQRKAAEAEKTAAKEKEKTAKKSTKKTWKSRFAKFKKNAAVGAGIGAGAVGAAASAAGSAGKKVASGVQNIAAIKSLTIILMILGLLDYIFKAFLGATSGTEWLPIVLFFLSGIVISMRVEKDKYLVFLPMILFILWIFVYQATLSLSFLIVVLIFLSIPLLLTKGEALQAELLGFVPAVIYFVSTMLLGFMVEEFALTPAQFLISLILFVPWWFYLGLWLLPEMEGFFGSLFTILKVVGTIALVIALFGSVIPNFGYSASNLDISSIQKTQSDMRESYGSQSIWYYPKCFVSSPTNVPACVENEQKMVLINNVCIKQKNLIEGSTAYQQCVEEEKAKNIVTGIASRDVKAPKFSFVERADFPAISSYQVQSYPMDIKIENPQEQPMNVEVSCMFKGLSGNHRSQEFYGVSDSSFISDNRQIQKTINCRPPPNLNGRYSLTYFVTFRNLITEPTLERLFVDSKEDLKFISEIRQLYFSSNPQGKSEYASFATLNFEIGNPSSDPVIKTGEKLYFSSSIVNLATGKVLAVQSYRVGMEDLGINCIDGSNLQFPKALKVSGPIYTKGCSVEALPPLAGDKAEAGYDFRDFVATMVYDYQFEKQKNIEVNVVNGNS